MPFAPHIAEELLVASTPLGGGEIDTSWPAGELVSTMTRTPLTIDVERKG